MKFNPSDFHSKMLWGFVLPMQASQCDNLFLTPLHALSSLPQAARTTGGGVLAPHQFSILPILFSMMWPLLYI